MRYLFSFILCLSCYSVFALSSHPVDSLLHLLKKNPSSAQKIQIYRNLADIYFESPEEKIYLLKLYREAIKSNDVSCTIEALNDIVLYESNDYKKDSIAKYVALIKEIAPAEKVKSLLPYYHMRFFNTLYFLNKGDEALKVELDFLNSNSQENNDIYRKIASAYNTGASLYENEQIKESIPYFENANRMAETLPESDKNMYLNFIVGKLCSAYAQTDRNKEAIKIMEQKIERIEQDYTKNYQKQRPFYKIELQLIGTYSFMIMNILHMSKEKEKLYWNKVLQIKKKLSKQQDLYTYYLSVYNYYTIKDSLSKSLVANDSLIKYAKALAPQRLPRLYELSSILLEMKEDYQNSLKYLKLSHEMKDSLNSQSVQQQLNELQVQYDLNKLSSEKNALEIKNKKSWVIFLTAILTLSLLICVYLFYSLRKEKRLKAQLKILHAKAHESEIMKQAFINSICHEIRTPLNAIVGFSDLILNPEIDEEMRCEFPAEIQKNTNQLTSLINSMLEVANLDVSEERLPSEPVEIKSICIQEIDILKDQQKDEIDYLLNIPESPIIISTHKNYLSTVLRHLLENANKFTTAGTITLSCCIDHEKRKVLISVTDTGCGIPDEKREEVFERFVKLDSFTPGNGLGLYLCRLIVRRLGGEIEFDAEYLTGARVMVSLPFS